MSEEDRRLATALFRYGVIAPLACRTGMGRDWAKALREEILSKTWGHPDGSERRVPERTLRHWLGRYRKHGFNGLFDDFRSDRGKSKAIPEAILEQAERLRRELPGRSVKTILELLERLGAEGEAPKERTLARQLVKRGATKGLLKKGAGSYQRWEQLYANDLWQGDTSHGVWLRDPDDVGKARKTKLIVFIDDATRICTHAEYYFDEQLPALIDCFGKALLKRGRPCRMLFDNAWIYHSTTLATMCAELGIEVSFCRPRAPQGKGKVERFIKTVQDSFEKEANHTGCDSLAELNAMFQAWLKKVYHEQEHSELNGKTPIERWKQDVQRVSLVTPDEIRRALLLRAKRKVHMSTATVAVDGRDYQASSELAGQEVEVRWNPHYPESVELWMCGEFIEVAKEFSVKSYVDKRERRDEGIEPRGLPYQSSKDYMQGLITGEHDDTFLTLKSDDLLTKEEFLFAFSTAFKRELAEQESDSLVQYFHRITPVRRAIVASTLERSVSVKGTELHLRFYLEQLDFALKQVRR